MHIGVVIVNYKTAEAAATAAGGVLDEMKAFPGSVLVVVDNDSQDGSFEQLQKGLADDVGAGRVAVIQSGHNGGFGYGVNVGTREVFALRPNVNHVFVVNPDATVDPGSLVHLAHFMDTHPDAGLLGSVVRDVGSSTPVAAFRFPSILSELEGTARLGVITKLLRKQMILIDADNITGPVDWVPGTAILIRAEVFAKVGFFDEGFFLYFEEIDFARRVRDAGFRTYAVLDAGVHHQGALSTGMNDWTRRMPLYWFDSRRRYLVKHHGRFYGAACDAAWICGHVIFKLRQQIGRKKRARARLGRDFISYSLSNLIKPAPQTDRNPPGTRA